MIYRSLGAVRSGFARSGHGDEGQPLAVLLGQDTARRVSPALAGLGGQPTGWRASPLYGGLSGKVFQVWNDADPNPYLLRLIPMRKSTRDRLREVYFSSWFARIGLAPTLLWFDTQYRFAIYTFVVVVDGAERFSPSSQGVVSLASTLGQLHRSKVEDPQEGKNLFFDLRQRIDVALQRWLHRPCALLQRHRDRVFAMIEREGLTACDLVLGHNDLNPGNVLWDGVRVWLIDWELTGCCSRWYDVAVSLLWCVPQDSISQQGFLAKYCDAADVRQPVDLARINQYAICALTFYGFILQTIAQDSSVESFERLAPAYLSRAQYIRRGQVWAPFSHPTELSHYAQALLWEAIERLENEDAR